MRLFGKLKEIKDQVFKRRKIIANSMDYDCYWEQKGNQQREMNSYQLFRYKYIKEKIEKGASVKDIGVGEGNILSSLDESINKIGLDVSDKFFNELRKKNINTKKIDLNSIEFNEIPNTQYSIMFEILEHIQNSEEVLLNVIKTTTKSVFISFPNTGYVSYRLRLLFGKFPLQWRTHPSEHIRFWTYSDLIWWLEELKLSERSKIVLYEGIPILNRVWPSLFGEAFLVEIRGN